MRIFKIFIFLFIYISHTSSFIHFFTNNYFKGLKQINTLNDFNSIKYCSKLSSSVYFDTPNITDYKYNTRIKIVEFHNNIYICFKGSSNFIDWKTNFDKSLITHYHNFHIFSIHKGYYMQYISVSNKIHNYLYNKNFDKLYICGHSLGGALATICSFDLVINNIVHYNNIYCITFGIPRIGDYNFSLIYNFYNITTYRIVLSGDPVPKLPINPYYIHSTPSYYLKNNNIYYKPNKIYLAYKKFISYLFDTKFSFKNHSINQYIHTLDLINF